jgi:steroid delta-isomerase-like uncharacterized protein
VSGPGRNRESIERLWTALAPGSALATLETFCAADYVRHSEDGDVGREELARALEELFAGFPDLAGPIEDLVAEGDRVAFRWSATGTHTAAYMGVPPTNKVVSVSGITISRFEGHLVAEEWASWNRTSILHALGIIPIGI